MVCTANYCRSPLAEQLLQAATIEKFGLQNSWRVKSAGTDARHIQNMHDFSAAALARRGAFVPGHVCRELEVTMLREADLILTAERTHRSIVAKMLPAAISRTFTMLQFARLCRALEPIVSGDPGELGRLLVDGAKAARALLLPVPPKDDDLEDPMGRSIERFEECALRLDVVVASLLAPLTVEPGCTAG